MQVTAFSTPANPSWRWRIVNNAGQTIAESHEGYPDIAAAVAHGTKHLSGMNAVDHSERVRSHWSTSHVRGR